jgi:release factor glutamine methyltransferase
VQYVLGVTPWRHFSLQVSPAVLIPRPETELLIDLAKQAVQDSPIADLGSGHWVDLGTGSGAITLGLADALPRAIIHGVDRSPAALAIAQQNADKLGLTARLHFYQGSWWSPLASLAGQVSGMVSNPPYIPTVSLAGLQPEVIEHEPLLALDGGHDGLEHIRHLVSTAPTYLRAGGIWLIEMMAGQAEDVVQLLEQQGSYQRIQVFSDLAGIDRFVLGIRC